MTAPDYPHLVREYPVMIHALGPDGRLSLGATFDMLQDIAGLHAAALGVGVPQLNELGITWVLSRLSLRFLDFPGPSDVVRLMTWPSGVERLFATRQFELVSARSGARLAVASSAWLMLRLSSLRPVLPSSVVPMASWLSSSSSSSMDIPRFFPVGDKIEQSAGADPLVTFIGQSRIDSNRHVNNTHYANFSLDWLSNRVGAPVRVSEFHVQFNYALKAGDSVSTSGDLIGDDAFRVVGHNQDGRNSFAASGVWAPV